MSCLLLLFCGEDMIERGLRNSGAIKTFLDGLQRLVEEVEKEAERNRIALKVTRGIYCILSK